jgi:hypothetical protein
MGSFIASGKAKNMSQNVSTMPIDVTFSKEKALTCIEQRESISFELVKTNS